MLNATRLNVFREVVEHGSFSGAADALSYSQSAVSQAIATLEGELGTPLIERRRGGVRPTPAGAALAAHVGGILARMDAAEEEVAAIARGRGGRLRAASFPTAGATLMPRAVAAFRASHPGVDLTLAEGEPEEIAPRLRAGEFDLALLFEFEGVGERLGAGMRRFELADDPLQLALAARAPARRPQADRARRPARGALGADLARQRQRQARRPLLPRGRLRAERLLRERRLPDRAGPGRGRGRRRPDPASWRSRPLREDIAIRALHPASPVRKVFAATPARRRRRRRRSRRWSTCSAPPDQEPAPSPAGSPAPDAEPPPGKGAGAVPRLRRGTARSA